MKLLDVRESTVTIGAIGIQKKIGKTIIKKKADYVLSVKKNQPRMYEDIRLPMEEKKNEFEKSGTQAYPNIRQRTWPDGTSRILSVHRYPTD